MWTLKKFYTGQSDSTRDICDIRVEPSRVEPTFFINYFVFLEFKWEYNKKETNSWSGVSLVSHKCNLINMWFVQEEEFKIK